MPSYLYPGMYIEETPKGQKAVEAAAPPAAAFAGEPVALSASWDDLILPEPQLATLREIAAVARGSRKHATPAHVTALFFGEVGTGKTLAAEVLATELDLPLFCVALSKVVSRYIGETEKRLDQLFEAAERSGAMLVFDEADALFGERTDVKDSHDRYANLDISRLLERLEEHSGLVVLTTNLKSNMDSALLRRLQFLVEFPLPDAEARARIWRRIIATQMVTDDVNVDELAVSPLTGGRIRNALVKGAFLAAEEGVPVHMRHLCEALRAELNG